MKEKTGIALAWAALTSLAALYIVLGIGFWNAAQREALSSRPKTPTHESHSLYRPDVRSCLDGPGGIDAWDCIRMYREDI